jgi:hypothetical protein
VHTDKRVVGGEEEIGWLAYCGAFGVEPVSTFYSWGIQFEYII